MNNETYPSNYYAPEDLRNILRLLWSQYALWTRFYIVSKVADLGDLEVVTNRLYEVPMDMYNVLIIYYNINSVQEFENLLREQISLTINVIDNIIANNTSEAAAAETMWRGNADRLSLLLSEMNPNWNHQMLQNLFYNQLDMTMDEAEKRKNRRYAEDVYQYNFIEYHTLMIADYLWNGIINQLYPKQ